MSNYFHACNSICLWQIELQAWKELRFDCDYECNFSKEICQTQTIEKKRIPFEYTKSQCFNLSIWYIDNVLPNWSVIEEDTITSMTRQFSHDMSNSVLYQTTIVPTMCMLGGTLMLGYKLKTIQSFVWAYHVRLRFFHNSFTDAMARRGEGSQATTRFVLNRYHRRWTGRWLTAVFSGKWRVFVVETNRFIPSGGFILRDAIDRSILS